MKNSIILTLSLIFLVSCTTIIKSEYRKSEPQSINIGKDVSLTSTGAININVPFIVNHLDFFPSSFRIEANGKIIYIDPVGIDETMHADYIFITHAHPDHFSLPDIAQLTKGETVIVCPPKAADKLPDHTVRVIKPGDGINLEGIHCEAVASYNMKSGFLTAHPKSDMNVGYLLTIDGLRIYHAGDTDYVPELLNLNNITVAMVPIDGDGLTMSTEDAANFINALNPSLAIPMHYEISKEKAKQFKQLVNTGIEVIIMQE